jgi:predicted nucleotidyltransferase
METMIPANHKEEILNQVVTALRIALGDRLVAVVLFGSQARGEAREDSDWDVLVIAEELPEDPLERGRFLRQLLPIPCRLAVSFLARTPQEFEERLSSLYLDIALDGQILYDPKGYAEERLTTLRRLIEGAGLFRERTPAGDLWRWKTPPRGRWMMSWEKIGEA